MLILVYWGASKWMSFQVFSTDRLIVRRWHDSDVAGLMEVYGDADANKLTELVLSTKEYANGQDADL